MKNNFLKLSAIFVSLVLILFCMLPEQSDARGSFGGSRGGGFRSGGSFGGSRSFSSRSYSSRPSGSFSRPAGGSNRSFGSGNANRSYSSPTRANSYSNYYGRTSFGGSRLESNVGAQARYGIPRQRQMYYGRTNYGTAQNYYINDYGGYSSSLMRGYMMGQVTGYMMWMPWHGAYWYTQPQYVENQDGTIDVYPPTFNWFKVFVTVIFVGAIILVVYVLFFRRNTDNSSKSSFS